MIFVQQNLIKSLCFSDTPVLKMEFSLETKSLKIFVRGSVVKQRSEILQQNNNNPWLGKGVLFFKNWNCIKVNRYVNEKLHGELDESLFEPLENILSFEEDSDCVKIAGLGYESNYWEEWTIVGSQYHGEFEEYTPKH